MAIQTDPNGLLLMSRTSHWQSKPSFYVPHQAMGCKPGIWPHLHLRHLRVSLLILCKKSSCAPAGHCLPHDCYLFTIDEGLVEFMICLHGTVALRKCDYCCS